MVNTLDLESVKEYEQLIVKIIKTDNIFDDTVDPKIRSEIETAALEHVSHYHEHGESSLDEKLSLLLPFIGQSKRIGLLNNIVHEYDSNKIDLLLALTIKQLVEGVNEKPSHWVSLNKSLTFSVCILKDFLVQIGIDDFLMQPTLPHIKKSLEELNKLPVENRRSVIDMHLKANESVD